MDSFKVLVLLFCISSSYGKIEYNTVRKELHRRTTYSPKIADKTCLLKPDPGPCRAAINMYYFDPLDMNCTRRFQWGGCMGNGNRFDTFSECIDTCLTQFGRKIRPHYCSLRFDYGFCFGDTKRWYYDELWHVCKETIYSGCGGNKNNFYSQQQCDAICRFGNGPVGKTSVTDHMKKVIIINPLDTTPHRGKAQKVDGGHSATQSENPTTVTGETVHTEKPEVGQIPG
ncbi:kunitz-type serine protease inhibitor A-like [Choristoneura fumiferana]|uniref:kunitz-type serine protease inhibitor A-like n=1 Tax=Choristoneura fumiferana TaxID=7141 RepID=UPI003D153D10